MVDAEVLERELFSQMELSDDVPLGHVRYQYRAPSITSLCIAMVVDLVGLRVVILCGFLVWFSFWQWVPLC